jgi:hypothetical protein
MTSHLTSPLRSEINSSTGSSYGQHDQSNHHAQDSIIRMSEFSLIRKYLEGSL